MMRDVSLPVGVSESPLPGVSCIPRFSRHSKRLSKKAILSRVQNFVIAIGKPAHAGARVSIGIGVPVVVAPAPVVVAPPPPAVVYPAPPVVVAAPPVVYRAPPVLVGGYYGPYYRHWRHHPHGWRRW